MARRGFLQFVLAALLLVAQQAAVNHAIWHTRDALGVRANNAAPGDSPGGTHDERSSQGKLCGFHPAFGQVLAAANGHASTLPAIAPAAEPLPESARFGRDLATLPPQSRAPPVFL